MFGYLLYLTRDRELADDLSGATFEKALRLWHRFDPRRGTQRDVAAWHRAHDRAGLVPRRGATPPARGAAGPARPETQEAPFVEGLSPVLEQALAGLSAGEREVIALRVVLDLDGEAAARVLGLSPTAVSTRLSRALERLEERIVR